MKDDTLYVLLLGVLIGLPLGMILYKQIFEKGTTPQTTYGAAYSYDEAGRLISYIPTPIPNKG